jgi:flagellar export protein FliJ
MSADLTVLIRLHKHELDEKRRVLGELYSAVAVLERERRTLERLFEMEKDAVKTNGDVHFTFSSYVEKVKQNREKIDKAEAELEKQVEKAKESLMETFSELKKYEMTQAERLRLEEEERQLRDAKSLDDIGLESFRRKGGED